MGGIGEPLVHVARELAVMDELCDAISQVVDGHVQLSNQMEGQTVVHCHNQEKHQVKKKANHICGHVQVKHPCGTIRPTTWGSGVNHPQRVLPSHSDHGHAQNEVLEVQENEHGSGALSEEIAGDGDDTANIHKRQQAEQGL